MTFLYRQRNINPPEALRHAGLHGDARAVGREHNQCTGGPGFQGDQDADPTNNPDCDSNVPGNSARNFVRTAELQVFRNSPEIDD